MDNCAVLVDLLHAIKNITCCSKVDKACPIYTSFTDNLFGQASTRSDIIFEGPGWTGNGIADSIGFIGNTHPGHGMVVASRHRILINRYGVDA